jgi:hypothetical protein
LTIGSPKYPQSEFTKLDITKLLVAARQMADVTVSIENHSQIPTALGLQLEDPPRAATARAVLVVAAAPLVAVAAAAVEVHHTTLVEELVAAAIVEAEDTRIATSPATHMAATMPATRSRRSIAKRLSKQVTVTASPSTPGDFAICSYLRNLNLSGSPSTTRSRTQFSG